MCCYLGLWSVFLYPTSGGVYSKSFGSGGSREGRDPKTTGGRTPASRGSQAPGDRGPQTWAAAPKPQSWSRPARSRSRPARSLWPRPRSFWWGCCSVQLIQKCENGNAGGFLTLCVGCPPIVILLVMIDGDDFFFRRRSAGGSAPGLAGCHGEAPAPFHLSHAREGWPEGAGGGVGASLHPAVRRDRHYRWDKNPVVYQPQCNCSPIFV